MSNIISSGIIYDLTNQKRYVSSKLILLHHQILIIDCFILVSSLKSCVKIKYILLLLELCIHDLNRKDCSSIGPQIVHLSGIADKIAF